MAERIIQFKNRPLDEKTARRQYECYKSLFASEYRRGEPGEDSRQYEVVLFTIHNWPAIKEFVTERGRAMWRLPEPEEELLWFVYSRGPKARVIGFLTQDELWEVYKPVESYPTYTIVVMRNPSDPYPITLPRIING